MNGNEYITKQQAIDLVKSFEVAIGCTGVSVLTREIERLEPVYPVQKGFWDYVRTDENGMNEYRCSKCQTKRYGQASFCSHCGARMG